MLTLSCIDYKVYFFMYSYIKLTFSYKYLKLTFSCRYNVMGGGGSLHKRLSTLKNFTTNK